MDLNGPQVGLFSGAPHRRDPGASLVQDQLRQSHNGREARGGQWWRRRAARHH